MALLGYAASAHARHRARLDPAEPIFTQRPFIEKDIELDLGWEKDSDGLSFQPSPSVIWIFWERLQLSLEMPFAINFPEGGATVGSLSDLSLGAQYLFCCAPNEFLLDYLSLRTDVEVPSGSLSKDIGGTGLFAFSLLLGRLLTVVEALPDLFLQVQLTYQQQIRLDFEQEMLVEQLGIAPTHEKDFVWNLACTQTYADGRLRPVFELLGTTVLDTLPSDDEGTIFELGVGAWVVPFADDNWGAPLSFGFGYRWPLTSRHETLGAALVIAEWAFDP